MSHIPVLLNEVIEYLSPKANQNFIDCTIGGGGHAIEILSLTNPRGELLGIDLTPEAIENLEVKFYRLGLSKRIKLVNDNFINIKQIINKNRFAPIHGILLDLGLSSDLLENSGRGFSFMRDEILDMRYNSNFTDLTAMEIINQYSVEDLTGIFKRYGGERFSWLVAKKIIQQRKKQKIKTTAQLRDIVKNSLGRRFHIKSLARIFQSLRIEVNDELENLEKVLANILDILRPESRIVVISYHSLEDRIVKQFFKQQKKINILTKKPITPGIDEIKKNNKARSAKLRAAIKI